MIEEHKLNQIKEFINSREFDLLALLLAPAVKLGYINFESMVYPDEVLKATCRMHRSAKREMHMITKACNNAIKFCAISFDGVVKNDNVELFFKSALEQLRNKAINRPCRHTDADMMQLLSAVLMANGYEPRFELITDSYYMYVRANLMDVFWLGGLPQPSFRRGVMRGLLR